MILDIETQMFYLKYYNIPHMALAESSPSN